MFIESSIMIAIMFIIEATLVMIINYDNKMFIVHATGRHDLTA
jgi:hypothetical protein